VNHKATPLGVTRSTVGQLAAVALIFFPAFCAQTGVAQSDQDKTLPSETRFYVPNPVNGSMQQAYSLLMQGKLKNALQIVAMESFPRVVWVYKSTPSAAGSLVAGTLARAQQQRAVPVFALYAIPGADCSGYTATSAQNIAVYEDWIDAIARAIGDRKAVVLLEPDGLASMPADCGYDPAVVDVAQATADRYTELNYAVSRLEAGPRTLVYLDAGHSAWHAVSDMTIRLVNAGVTQTQGFFSNQGNFQFTDRETKFDTWISECVAFGINPNDGGWRLGHFDWCASQYYSPLGPVDFNNIATWIYTDEWFQQNLGTAVPTVHFLIDTSGNAEGPFNTAVYENPPFNQTAATAQTLNNGEWCNSPRTGLGFRPTVNTGVPLLDAYVWIKSPGVSDGTCNAENSTRAWDYSLYTQSGWPTDAAGQATFDPLWGLVDPVANTWFPQMALEQAKLASPPLLP
jgi:endoglucanase